MPWYFQWPDAIKKRACRYLLQRYLGQFLQEKLSLDQLSVDLYNGTGTISEVNLDVETLNELGETYNLPVEFVDGFISSISVSIPWSSLLADSSYVEVQGLVVTVQPKQRSNCGSMFDSMWGSMTTSIQLAQECLKQDVANSVEDTAQPLEGLEVFAQTIESVLCRIKVRFLDTVIRLEHVPKDSKIGMALEMRIKKIDYFDEAGTEDVLVQDQTRNVYEPAAFTTKKFHVEGVSLYTDEFPSAARTYARSLSPNASPDSMRCDVFNMAPVSPDLPPQHMEYEKSSVLGDNNSSALNVSLTPDPILIGKLMGRQEVRLKLKQADCIPGPKVDIELNLGSTTYFFSPRQVHILLELAYGLVFPDIEDNSNVASKRESKSKPMGAMDYERVEEELQKQLNPQYPGLSLQHHHGWSSQSLDDSDEDFLPMVSPAMTTSTGSESVTFGSDLEMSTSSIGSNTTKTHYARHKSKSDSILHSNQPKHKGLMQAFLEDPSAELTHYKVRVSTVHVIILHDDILTTTSENGGLVAQSSVAEMKSTAEQFFKDLSAVTMSIFGKGFEAVREKLSEIVKANHLRLSASPIIIEGNEKTWSSQRTCSANLSCGTMELVECLLNKQPVSNASAVQTETVEYCDLLTFEMPDQAQISSLAEPCLRLSVKHVEKIQGSRRRGLFPPKTDIHITMGPCQLELDVTIVDRINALLNPQPLSGNYTQTGTSFFQPSAGVNNQSCFSQVIDEGDSSSDRKVNLKVSSSSVILKLRFPVPDLRALHDMDRVPWWKRSIRKDILTLKLASASLSTTFDSRESTMTYELRCKEVIGMYQETSEEPPFSFMYSAADDKNNSTQGDEGFDWPQLIVKVRPKRPTLIVEEEFPEEGPESMPISSIDTLVFQLSQPNSSEPSPFSSRRVVYENQHARSAESNGHQKNPFTEGEQMVMPGDKAEMAQFIEKTSSNCRFLLDLNLPNLAAYFPSKHFYEVLYNRITTDLLLWEPAAPKPMNQMDSHGLRVPSRLDLASTLMQDAQLMPAFSLCKSALQGDDSSSESEDDTHIYYSVYEHKHKQRKQMELNAKCNGQHKIAVNITTNQGRLTMYAPFRDASGVVVPSHHGELHLQVEDGLCFLVSGYHGQRSTGYLCLQANRAAVFHAEMVPTPVDHPSLQSISEGPEYHLSPTVYQSEPGVYTKLSGSVGIGGDSMDMLSTAIKIEVDSPSNIKTFKVALGIRDATLRYHMSETNQSWFNQFIDFFDVRDLPVAGYSPPAVVTELHLHLWSCSVDYRPLNLPLRSVITMESFSISSNIAAQTSTSLLRFIAEEAALFISDKCEEPVIDLKKNYVCVADMGYFDLCLRISDGKDSRHPRVDLRASNNVIHIRTCSDSCCALQNLLTYFASDGDLYSKSGGDKSQSESSEVTSMEDTPVQGQVGQVHDLMAEAMWESSSDCHSSSGVHLPKSHKAGACRGEVFLFPDEATPLPPLAQPPAGVELDDSSALPLPEDGGHFSADEEFCILEDDPGIGFRPKSGEPEVRVLTTDPIRLIENHYSIPITKTDQLKAPKHFPLPVLRYTLQEMSLVWHLHGGHDFDSSASKNNKKGKEKYVKVVETNNSREVSSSSVSFSKSTPHSVHWVAANSPPKPNSPRHPHNSKNWQVLGGPGRQQNVLMELQMNKVQFQYEMYPENTEQAARQVLLIHEVEIRDRLASSQINKFLYQYSCEAMPRQSHANMVVIKAVHIRPDPALPAQECCLKVSLLPLRLNVDQDALLFLYSFFSDITAYGSNVVEAAGDIRPPPQAPVMTVQNASGLTPPEPQQLLIMLEETTEGLVQDLVGPLEDLQDSAPSQPVFFRSFVFSPQVLIRLDYHGKRVDMEQGTLAGLLMGLGQLNCSELRLKRLCYRHGLLGMDKLLAYACSEWLQDIKKNQLPSLLGGVGPMHSLVQLVQGIRDLFWLPIEQYRKDGRIVRGLQRGANAFTTSTAMAALELTNRLVQAIQSAAETAYDMVSPGPSVRKHGVVRSSRRKRPSQPVDIREGMANAYQVVREGLGDTARTIVRVASEEHEQKGISGAVGGVLRQIPPTVVKPIILATEATSNVLGGMRHQLVPDARREAAEKWRSDEAA